MDNEKDTGSDVQSSLADVVNAMLKKKLAVRSQTERLD